MGIGPRIRGQEVEVILLVDNQIVRSLNSIKSFEMKYQQEIMSEGYLGERTERKDAIFKGIGASIEVNFSDKGVFAFFSAIVDRSKRRTPGTKINVKATLNLPSGERVRVIIPDVEFGEIPISFGSRSDYGTVSLEMEASDCNVIS